MNRNLPKKICVETAVALQRSIRVQIKMEGAVSPEWANIWRGVADHDRDHHAVAGFRFFTDENGRVSEQWQGNKTRK